MSMIRVETMCTFLMKNCVRLTKTFVLLAAVLFVRNRVEIIGLEFISTVLTSNSFDLK